MITRMNEVKTFDKTIVINLLLEPSNFIGARNVNKY